MRKGNTVPRTETRAIEFFRTLDPVTEYELMRQRIFGGIR
jgi:hypothetical protein